MSGVAKPTVLVAEKLGAAGTSASQNTSSILFYETTAVPDSSSAAGLEMLQQVANVDCSYNLTPEELYAKVALSDALIVRSATKVRLLLFY